MRADSIKISKVFSGGGDIHYVLPYFQREYSWEESNWKTLLEDAFAIYEEYQPEKEPEHFLGSLVVINDGTINGVIPTFKLVDGQQRLTTISLLFCALRNLILKNNPALAKKIQKMLINPDEEGDVYFKVLPTNKYGDREAYTTIIRGEKTPDTESNIPKAYEYLQKEIGKKLTSDEIKDEQFFIVLSNCFQVVFIDLNQDESPYKIFESLNAKGKLLTQADLVRNYMAMKLPTAQQEKVFTSQWEKIENLLQERRTVGKSRLGELTAFLRHYLAMHSRLLCNEAHIYARFRDRIEREFNKDEIFIKEIEKLRRFAEYYDKLLRPQKEQHQEIQNALIRLNTLEIQTAYPFLLEVYNAYQSQIINSEDVVKLLTVLENYMVRRYVCGERTSYLSPMFPTLWRDIINEMGNEPSFIKVLKKVLVNKNYPSNHEVQQSIPLSKLYEKNKPKKICLVLETINRHLSKGAGGFTTLDGEPSIEHILPQTPSEEWKTALAENLDRTYREYLHTLGNLTVVTKEWNSELSNANFFTKKQKLAEHALQINRDYFSQNIDNWYEKAIQKRANFIAQKFLEIWPAIGEAEPIATQSYGKPRAITICGSRIDLTKNTWRQVMIETIEWVIKNRPEQFNRVRQKLGNYFCDSLDDKRNKQNWHQLSNNIWVNLKGSARVHTALCNRLLGAVGISESEWSIEEVDTTTLTNLSDI